MSDINFLSSSGEDSKKPKKKAPTSSSSVEVEFHAPEPEKKEPNPVLQKVKEWFSKHTEKSAQKKEKKNTKHVSSVSKGGFLRTDAPVTSIGSPIVEKNVTIKKEEEKKVIPKPVRPEIPKVTKQIPTRERTLETPHVQPVNKKDTTTSVRKHTSVASLKKGGDGKRQAMSFAESETPDIDVNLMPWQDPSIKRNRIIRWGSMLAAVGIVIVWGTMMRVDIIGKETRITGLEERVSTLDNQLKNIDAELLAQGSTMAINQKKFLEIYNEMPLWSTFLSWLEDHTNDSTYYTQMSVKSDHAISLEARSRDYNTAASQWLTFQNATTWIDYVGVSGFSKVSGTDVDAGTYVEFSIELEISDTAMRRDSQL